MHRVGHSGHTGFHVTGTTTIDAPVLDDRLERIGVPESDRFGVHDIEMAVKNGAFAPVSIRGTHGDDVVFVFITPGNRRKSGVVVQPKGINGDKDRRKGEPFQLGFHQVDGRGFVAQRARFLDKPAGKIHDVIRQAFDGLSDFLFFFIQCCLPKKREC